MPVNFAFVASCGNAGAHFKGSQMQFQVVEILGMTRNLGGKAASSGKIAKMAAGGIDSKPGAPKDLNKIIVGSPSPRPITPQSDLGIPADARIDSAFASGSGSAPYANVPGDAGYANNGGGNPANGSGTIIPYVPDPAAEIGFGAPRGADGAYGLPIYRPQLG